MAETAICEYKAFMKQSQQERNELRQQNNLSDSGLEQLIRQSQFEKAELKRLKDHWKAKIEAMENEAKPWQELIASLQDERKSRSAALQQWIFRQFRMHNALGEIKDLCDIFVSTPQGIPPAGSGECAAPKLLQHAYLHGLQPLAMAEFWWGDSPKGEIRKHGYFYPSCKHKCEPILNFMMKGLDVEPNPLLTSRIETDQLETVYEDEYLLVVNKPSGMLSVPGKTDQVSVASIMAEKYPDATGPLVVHRLDMDTSGLLLIAKTKEIHAELQEQFETRQIKKRYIALLSGKPEAPTSGFIRLPLIPDYDNRPLQTVDYEQGKPAVTRYELLSDQPPVRIAFYPETGRTHQLRVHAAHKDGLNNPILGDPLYGQPAERLHLHAERLEFRHPVTNKILRITADCPF
jgi:tRNA pseudouridine32 synthase/23S rRNA pseudouridine746 synthase